MNWNGLIGSGFLPIYRTVHAFSKRDLGKTLQASGFKPETSQKITRSSNHLLRNVEALVPDYKLSRHLYVYNTELTEL